MRGATTAAHRRVRGEGGREGVGKGGCVSGCVWVVAVRQHMDSNPRCTPVDQLKPHYKHEYKEDKLWSFNLN